MTYAPQLRKPSDGSTQEHSAPHSPGALRNQVHMMTTPIEALYDNAIVRSVATAFIHEDVVCTYYDLVIASEQLARALLSRGVQHGDRIVLHVSNRR